MKKTIFTFLLAVCISAGYSQLNNQGGTITVDEGAQLVIEGNYTSSGSGTMVIDGTVLLKGNFINTSGSIPDGSNGRLVFNGSSAQEITGAAPTTFYCAVEVNNAAGVSLTNTSVGADQTLDSVLYLTDGKITLNGFDLTLNNEPPSGASSSSFVVTNGDGRLIAQVPTSGSTAFPVGFDASNYFPAAIANANVADKFAVQVKDGLLDNCGDGNPIINDVVTLRWDIDPSVGTATEADVTLTWNAGQEGTGFTNTDCSIIHCDAGEYTAVGGYGNGFGYSITGTDITDFSWFGVGDGVFGNVLASTKIFLQGPYSSGAMNYTLLTDGLLPTSQPYSDASYDGSHLDYDGTESIGTLPANTVDWVLVELRTGTAASTTVDTVAALLLSDGSVVASSGTGAVPFKGLTPGNYYLVLHHRNHLSVMTASTVSLTRSSASTYDFTSALTQAYDNPSITLNDQMVNLGSGVYGLWAGDANFNNVTSYTGSSTDKNAILNVVGLSDPTIPVTNTYSTSDVNMDSDVSYTGSGSDKNVVLNAVGLADPTIPVTSHLPN